jgi:peptidyl-prolyl cis-trans isomerase A (cyclophilin A)
MLKRILLIITLCLTAATVMATDPPSGKNPVVLMETSLGNVKLELYQKSAPVSVRNFLDYVSSGYYSGTIFHRYDDPDGDG